MNTVYSNNCTNIEQLLLVWVSAKKGVFYHPVFTQVHTHTYIYHYPQRDMGNTHPA